MATGDAADFAARIRAVLPGRWFPVQGAGETTPTPILDAVLLGLGTAWAAIYALRAFVIAQARIATASGVWLDFIAVDFFGRTILRQLNEGDAAFSRRIRGELLRPRGTRAAMIRALYDLTGRTPRVFEPAHPPDTGGWGHEGMTLGTGLAYGLAGGWGSLQLPYQCFVTAYRPAGGGVADVSGYYLGSGWAGGGYGVGAIQWISEAMFTGAVTDADIYETTARTMPAATVAWTGVTV